VSSACFCSVIVRPRHAATRRGPEHRPLRSITEERGSRRPYINSATFCHDVAPSEPPKAKLAVMVYSEAAGIAHDRKSRPASGCFSAKAAKRLANWSWIVLALPTRLPHAACQGHGRTPAPWPSSARAHHKFLFFLAAGGRGRGKSQYPRRTATRPPSSAPTLPKAGATRLKF
jgi:hypothetical protein